MLPDFPKFKPLEIEDYAKVAHFTSQFLPYSDYNFISLYAWNVSNSISLSTLNDNLIIQFSDYISNKPFLSFIGSNKTFSTIDTLLLYSENELRVNALKLIPECSLQPLHEHNWIIKEETSSHDYILSINALSALGVENGKLSKAIKKFQAHYPSYEFFEKPATSDLFESMIKLFEVWIADKPLTSVNLKELAAFKRMLNLSLENCSVYMIALKDELIAFDICELVSNNYAISHFCKSLNHHVGINETLQWHEAVSLAQKGISFLNIEQDLGLSGLRFAKTKFNPCHYLKKYSITKPDYL